MRCLTLYLRGGCSLCEAFVEELLPLQGQHPFELIIEEVDRNPAWVQRYGEKVPVLVDEAQRELCHYFLDPKRVVAALAEVPPGDSQ